MDNYHRWISIWVVASTLMIFLDSSFCFARPKSFEGGEWHWFWKPFGYGIYQNVDLNYGVEAYKRGDGFPNAQSLLNVLETLVNLVYLYLVEVSQSPIAPLVGFGAATASFSKTILYWAVEYYCNYCTTGHNDPLKLIFIWLIPTGAWIVVPALIMRTLGKDIAASLYATSGKRLHSQVKLNGKHQ
ncbi:hypothetical protein CPB86DRAFT_788326 [Serendipita vermifera]|nr:hypothetical protein CPB86DRAFT_788326 [Serendipita vermifera]